MSLIIVETPIPLKTDVDGVVRVGNSRVTLDTVIAAFTEGATAASWLQKSARVMKCGLTLMVFGTVC